MTMTNDYENDVIVDTTFLGLLKKVRGEDWRPPARLLSIDPGETTGWSYFEEGQLKHYGQIVIPTFKDSRIDAMDLWYLFERYKPDAVVIEGYRIYAAKAKHHTWSALYTPKLIGYLEAICQHSNRAVKDVSYYIQMASSKMFCTNEKLKRWGYYPAGERHAADAIRHGCYWLLFHGRK